MSKFFLDTNIVIYASNSELNKADKANTLIFEEPLLISLQVINEVSNICLKKLLLDGEAVISAIKKVTSATDVDFSLSTQLQVEFFC
jgi:predicted nucleic acid-binding protein